MLRVAVWLNFDDHRRGETLHDSTTLVEATMTQLGAARSCFPITKNVAGRTSPVGYTTRFPVIRGTPLVIRVTPAWSPSSFLYT